MKQQLSRHATKPLSCHAAKQLLMSNEYPCFCTEMAKRGYEIIPTKNIEIFHPPERRHADMQAVRIRDRLFTLDGCVDTVGREYPANVRLNCLYLGGRLYGNLKAADTTVLDFCLENGIETVHINQGYTRCSALVVNERAVITADKSIEKAMKQNGAEVLPISAGHIRLDGFDYGFIGGCSCTDGDTVFFFGDIKKHPDYAEIKAFINNYNSNIEILCKEIPLTDIGGAVLL